MSIHQEERDSMNKKLAIIFIAISTLTTACVTPSVKEYTGPDGRSVKTVKCSKSPEKCFITASSSCSGGTYQVVTSESHAGGLIADILPGPVTWYGMTYICGPSDGKMPYFAFKGRELTLPYPPPKPIQVEVEVKTQPTTTRCNESRGTITCKTY